MNEQEIEDRIKMIAHMLKDHEMRIFHIEQKLGIVPIKHD